MKIATIGLDLAKNFFHVVCCNERGKQVKRKQLRRFQMLKYFSNFPTCLVFFGCAAGPVFRGLFPLLRTAKIARFYQSVLGILAGIPSVVYGLWGLLVLVPLIRKIQPTGASLLAGILILALMIFPTIALADCEGCGFSRRKAGHLDRDNAGWGTGNRWNDGRFNRAALFISALILMFAVIALVLAAESLEVKTVYE